MKSTTRTWMAGGLAVALAILAGAASAQTLSAGDGWRIEIDSLSPPLEAMRREIRRAGAPVRLDALGMDVSNASASVRGEYDKRALVDGWSDEIVGALEDQGFETVDEDEWEEQSGVSFDDMRETILEGMPYNMRDSMRERFGDVQVLLNGRTRGCPAPDGLSGAVVMSSYAEEDVRSEYGSVAVFFMAVGTCGNAAYQGYLGGLRRLVQRALVDALEYQD